MTIYDPVKLVAEGLKLTQKTGDSWNAPRSINTARLEDALRTTPHECDNITSAANLRSCTDAYCGAQSKNGTTNPDVDISRLWATLRTTLHSPHLGRITQRAVVGKILSTYKDLLCKEGPPPPSAVVPVEAPVPIPEPEAVSLPDDIPPHISNCGYSASLPPVARAGWLAVMGGFLTIVAFRATQFTTGSFFLFFSPENRSIAPDEA